MMENERGKERKMNSGPTTVNEGERTETKVFANRECYKKYSIPKTLRPM
jgi:hypothetical protein